jgi:signal transduction histidine kinase
MAAHSPTRTQSARLTLIGLLVIPTLSLAGLWGFVATVTLGNVIRDQHYNSVTTRTGVAVSVLSADLLTERAATLTWLGSGRPDGTVRAQLESARQGTDKYVPLARSSFESVLGVISPTAKKQVQRYFAQLAGLNGIRSAIDAGTDSQATAFGAYSAILEAEYAPFLAAVSTSDAEVSLMSQGAIAETRATDYSDGALALIQGAVAAHGRMPQPERELFAEVVGQQKLEVADMYALATSPSLVSILDGIYATPAFHQLETLENKVAASPAGQPIPVSSATIAPLLGKMAAGYQSGGEQLGVVLSAASARLSDDLLAQLYVAGGLGLVAVISSVVVMVRFGRRLQSELRGLYDSARQMANERLPRLVDRLRRGEDVDAEAASPRLRTGRITEIADVAEAFSTVQRTAVEAAVGQAALRKGVNQVFVSLSLRNQSLLHRQLSMLDDMERATSDPAVLGDLFRLDHLTTRMRRHAEGLLILAGSTPGRGWRDPVPVADVLQAAVAEVEDYVRLDVLTESDDAVAGTAVNDIIHLLAELAENATQFSPPDTRVRVTGNTVGRGFAVEIEDRGLGMPEAVMAELNARLASPPEFDLANTDQLGLFVAARLARRHGIKITLRPSPYGGTTAVVVLPREVISADHEADSWFRPDSAGELTTGFGLTGRHRGAPSQDQGAVRPPGLPPAHRRLEAPTAPPPAPERVAAFEPFQPGPFAPADGSGPAPGGSGTPASHMGMPRRVRQASLAPQLRRKDGEADPVPLRPAAAGPARSPEQTSAALSALQAGWLRGRLDDLQDLDAGPGPQAYPDFSAGWPGGPAGPRPGTDGS